jgi:1-acyl-sn-glycerol-3-phosphate acyltransferase
MTMQNTIARDIELQSLPRNPEGIHWYQTRFSRCVRYCSWGLGRIIWALSFRTGVINRAALDTPGGYQIACTHISHLEPFLLGIFCSRPVDWLTRIEFYNYRWTTWFLQRFGAIPVRRQGVAASAIREAIHRLKNNRVIAIAPEGGVACGKNSVCRGAKIKRGVCLIACRSGKPVIPCVILGSHKLQSVWPYLPFRRGRLYLAFGEPLFAPADADSPRHAREILAGQIEQSFVSLYQKLLDTFKLEDRSIP